MHIDRVHRLAEEKCKLEESGKINRERWRDEEIETERDRERGRGKEGR